MGSISTFIIGRSSLSVNDDNSHSRVSREKHRENIFGPRR